LLQRERLTKAEQETINQLWRLHVGEDVPEERYYLCANKKLDPRAYQMRIDAFRLPKQEILFAAFGGWDAAGAKSFGYETLTGRTD
jgi:hypothetical protein